MTIVRDCTGVYLRPKTGLDLYVCNSERVEQYTTGTKVKVRYDKLEECFGLLETPTCQMERQFDSKVEITHVVPAN